MQIGRGALWGGAFLPIARVASACDTRGSAATLAKPVHTWIPPRELNEYELIRSQGESAMGKVYLVLDRPVAIEFPSRHLDATLGSGPGSRPAPPPASSTPTW